MSSFCSWQRSTTKEGSDRPRRCGSSWRPPPSFSFVSSSCATSQSGVSDSNMRQDARSCPDLQRLPQRRDCGLPSCVCNEFRKTEITVPQSSRTGSSAARYRAFCPVGRLSCFSAGRAADTMTNAQRRPACVQVSICASCIYARMLLAHLQRGLRVAW